VRKLILGGVGLLALGGLLLFATDVRPQNTALNDLRFSALPPAPKAPAGNPSTKDKVTLGRALFWDPILSGRKDVACATCHHPRFGYAENRDLSIGVDGVGLGASRHFKAGSTVPFVKRNSQTILNTAFNGITDGGAYDASIAPMFWDLRAKGLEAQALEPIKTLEEMRGDTYTEANAISSVVARLNAVAEYRALFARGFGGVQPISADQLGQALATFQRSLTANNAPFDRYMRGDATAMSDAQLRACVGFNAWDASTVTTGRCSPITSCMYSACPTTRSSGCRMPASIRPTPFARHRSAISRIRRRTCTVGSSIRCVTFWTFTMTCRGGVAAREMSASAANNWILCSGSCAIRTIARAISSLSSKRSRMSHSIAPFRRAFPAV